MVASSIALQLGNLLVWRNSSLLLKTQPRRMVGAGNVLLRTPTRRTKQTTTYTQNLYTIWRQCARKKKTKEEKERNKHIFCCHTRNIYNYKQKEIANIRKLHALGKDPRKSAFLISLSSTFSPHSHDKRARDQDHLQTYHPLSLLSICVFNSKEEWIFLKQKEEKWWKK